MTDEFQGYKVLAPNFASHESRQPQQQGIRSRRGLYGTFHSVSGEHLHRYANEWRKAAFTYSLSGKTTRYLGLCEKY